MLRYYQSEAAPAIFDYIENNEGKHPCVAYPTGAGKTIIIAEIIRYALERWPNIHIVILSHVKEILKQDYDALNVHLDRAVGLWSSGLGSNSLEQITVAGIQSVYSKCDFFFFFELVIIDEAHLIPSSGDGMYQTFFKGIGEHVRIGLTATPFRLGSGYLYGNDGTTMFDDLVVDYTSMESFNKLIDDGYLCNLRTMATKIEMNTDDIKIVAGDFSEKELKEKFDKKEFTEKIVAEIIRIGENFNKWLIFAIDIEHAEHITELLLQNGIDAYVVHSKMSNESRDNVIKLYKTNVLRAIVNVNILTTGFDAPDIDLICTLRPTKSPVIHVQSIGRGLRIHPSKAYTMVLDFAGNTERLGPINDVQVRKKRKGSKQDPVTKRCPECNAIHHPSVRICDNCGHEFVFKSDLRLQSTDANIIVRTSSHIQTVDHVKYRIHERGNNPRSLRVDYVCGLRQFSEYINIEHSDYALHRAIHWIERRLPDDIDIATISNAFELYQIADRLKIPDKIEITEGGKYAKIKKYLF